MLCGKQEAAIGKVDLHVSDVTSLVTSKLKSKLISMFILLGEMKLKILLAIPSIPYLCLFSIEIYSFPIT